jgi:hypothetical protein
VRQSQPAASNSNRASPGVAVERRDADSRKRDARRRRDITVLRRALEMRRQIAREGWWN